MPSTSQQIDAILTTQGNQLQALARNLVSNEHSAEDIVQDAWIKSRTGAAADGAIQSAGAWLRRLVANLGRDHQRANRSRSHHEQLAARKEATTADEAGLAQGDVWLGVMDAVSSLAEPYKGVITERYFQGLKPRAIANKRGVPLATIKSQLHRALDMLRARLDDQYRGRGERWAIVLSEGLGARRLGWGPAYASVACVAGLVIFLAGYGVMEFGASEPASAGASPSSSPAWGVGEGTLSQEARANSASQEPVPQGAAADGRVPVHAAAPEHEEELSLLKFGLNILTVDALDVPVANVEVLLNPVGHPLNLAGVTGKQGELELRWYAEAPEQDYVFALRRRGELLTGLQVVHLKAGAIREMRLPVRYEPFTSRFATGEPEPAGSGYGNPIPMNVPRIPLAVEFVEGEQKFHFLWAAPDASALLRERTAQAQRPRSMAAVDAPASAGGPHSRERVEMFSYSGTVTRANGEPATEVRVLSWGEGEYISSFPGFPDGSFEFSMSPHRKLWLRVGGGPDGLATTVAPVDPDDTSGRFEWFPTLDRGNEVLGRILVDGQLAPGNWYVDLESEGVGAFYGDVNQCLDGGIAIPNLPPGEARLVLMTAGSWPLAVRVQELRVPSVGNDLALQVEDLRSVPVEVLVLDPNGTPCRADVQLWQVSSGRGVWMNFDADSGWHKRSAIPPGAYTVRVGDGVHGFAEYGEFHADGSDKLQIGPLRLKAPGMIQLREDRLLGEPGSAWHVERLQNGARSTMIVGDAQDCGLLQVPAGDYEIWLDGPHPATTPVRVKVEPGGLREE